MPGLDGPEYISNGLIYTLYSLRIRNQESVLSRGLIDSRRGGYRKDGEDSEFAGEHRWQVNHRSHQPVQLLREDSEGCKLALYLVYRPWRTGM
jgi:hypothetical protein